MRIDVATDAATRPTTIEPSRAWILGLVVDADGSVWAPAPADEWPGADALDQTMTPDGPSVRP